MCNVHCSICVDIPLLLIFYLLIIMVALFGGLHLYLQQIYLFFVFFGFNVILVSVRVGSVGMNSCKVSKRIINNVIVVIVIFPINVHSVSIIV